MKPPRRIKVGHLSYTVTLVDPSELPANVDADVCHDTLEMRIGKHMAAGQMAEKVLHEVLHAAYDSYKLDPRWGEEKTVTAMAPALCAVVHDNPRLVKWLQAALRGGE